MHRDAEDSGVGRRPAPTSVLPSAQGLASAPMCARHGARPSRASRPVPLAPCAPDPPRAPATHSPPPHRARRYSARHFVSVVVREVARVDPQQHSIDALANRAFGHEVLFELCAARRQSYARLTQERREPRRLRLRHGSSECRQPVVASPLIILVRTLPVAQFDNEPSSSMRLMDPYSVPGLSFSAPFVRAATSCMMA